jgi:peptidyl-prolyl cis-trans isomerase SurA
MINKKRILFIILIIFINLKVVALESAYIVYKIGGDIITNIDIENEKKYLIALNQQLENLNEKQLLDISKQSIIKETIKKKEVLKYFILDQTDNYINTVVSDLVVRLKLDSLDELKEYLREYDLTINQIKQKIEIETFWNRLIYDKFINQLTIDEEAIKQKISERKETNTKKIYRLSEIVFEKDANIDVNQKFKKISESIEEIGFKNTANLYSIADSTKFGGDIGWIEANSLSGVISELLNKVNINDYIKPIPMGANFLILKIEDIKFEKVKIDEKKEFIKILKSEKNRQLDNYSKIYYNKIEINIKIDEL